MLVEDDRIQIEAPAEANRMAGDVSWTICLGETFLGWTFEDLAALGSGEHTLESKPGWKITVTLKSLAETLAAGPPLKGRSLQIMEVWVSEIILIQLLGEEVARELLQSNSSDRRFESARRFLRMDGSEDTSDSRAIGFARFVWLAEGLFNLQRAPGFDKLIVDIRGGNLQAAWEEIAFAMLLLQRGIPFRFLHPSTVSGEKTADLEVMLNGLRVACEVEGKEESTLPTAGSVRNTLEHARKQLPKSRPGIILLKIPEAWKGESPISTVFQGIQQFFRTTDRVVAVIVRSERHTPARLGEGGSESGALLLLRRNHRSSLLTSNVHGMLDRIWSTKPRGLGTPLGVLAIILAGWRSGGRTNLGWQHV